MNLKKIVIHEIKKEPGSKEADPRYSSRCLDSNDERRKTLVSKLAESFRRNRNRVDYADFQREEEFPQNLKGYLESKLSEADFLDFSKRSVNRLYEQIQLVIPAKGGYLVFTEFIFQQQEYIGIFLVRDTEGDIFTSSGGVVDVDNIKYTDTSKLAMACRINVGKFQRGEDTPIMMTNKKTQEVSEYFAVWLGASDRETSETYTEKLHQVIKDIPLPKNLKSEDGEKISIDEIRSKVYDIVSNDFDHNANVNVISKLVYGDEDVIANYIDEKNIELPSEFKTHPASMKKMIEVKVKDDGIALQFSRGDYHKKVNFGDDHTVIINSPAIYKSLQEQLGENNE